MKSEQSEILLAELGPILKHYAELMGYDEDMLWRWYSEDRDGETLPGEQYEFASDVNTFKENLSKLYDGKINESYPLKFLQELLRTFNDPDIKTDMPGLMAEWLEASIEDHPIVCLSLENDFTVPSNGTEPKGQGATYKNAKLRLNDFECAFVTVLLDENESNIKSCEQLGDQIRDKTESGKVPLPPHTNPHIHPGDEFILVRTGAMHVRLDNSGIFSILNEGDFVHFNAEIPHSLWNLDSKPCEALVVRFFQLERHGTRQRQREVLDVIRRKLDELGDLYGARPAENSAASRSNTQTAALKERTGEELLALWDQIQAWVNDRTRPPRDRLRSTENARSVLDHVGLCAFLANFFAQEFPEDNGSIGTEEKSLRVWYCQHTRQENDWGARLEFRRLLRDYLQKEYGRNAAPQLEQYLTGISNQEDAQDDLANLSKLAKQLGIPRILLDAYLAPAALRAVIVRGANRPETAYGFDYIPDPDPDANRAKNAKYWLPARTLVNSDMSITLLAHAGREKPKTSETDWNRHPGFEVLIPLLGTATVEYRDLDLSSLKHECEAGSILVYRSSWSHRVRLSKSAQVLVMRFNIVDHKAIESFQKFQRSGEPKNELYSQPVKKTTRQPAQAISELVPETETAKPEISRDDELVVEDKGRLLRRLHNGVEKKRVELSGKEQELFWCLYSKKKTDREEWQFVEYETIYSEIWDREGWKNDRSHKEVIQQAKRKLAAFLKPLSDLIQIKKGTKGGYQLIRP